MEWAKNLLNLNRHEPAAWKVQRARELFDGAWSFAWDDAYGELVYGFAPNRSWCDTGKYFWVQAEAFATAALLHEATSNMTYLHQYKRLWSYIWQKWIDHRYGAWYGFNLTRKNELVNDRKAIAGAKCDYQSMQACITTLTVFE